MTCSRALIFRVWCSVSVIEGSTLYIRSSFYPKLLFSMLINKQLLKHFIILPLLGPRSSRISTDQTPLSL